MKETMNVTRFTISMTDCVLTEKSIGIAEPANIKDTVWFRNAIENAQLDALILRANDKIESIEKRMDKMQESDKFDRTKFAVLESDRDSWYGMVHTLESKKHSGIEYEHTIAHAVSYALFSCERGTKKDTRIPFGMYAGYRIARDLLKTGSLSDKSDKLQELTDMVRNAMNALVANDDNPELTKKFTARVNLAMTRNLCYTLVGKFNYSKSGINITVYDEREFARQAILMCLEKTFRFTDIVKSTANTYTEF